MLSLLVLMLALAQDRAPELFRKISRITVPGGIFMTYSVKGEIKRALRANGFRVTLLPGPAGKRHILRAFKS